MNPVERVLYRELTELLDRLAASLPQGSLEQVRASSPTLKARLDEAEGSLAGVRSALLDGYGRWRRALEDVENLWALAAWRSTAAEEPAEKAAALAARGGPPPRGCDRAGPEPRRRGPRALCRSA